MGTTGPCTSRVSGVAIRLYYIAVTYSARNTIIIVDIFDVFAPRYSVHAPRRRSCVGDNEIAYDIVVYRGYCECIDVVRISGYAAASLD